MKIFICISFKRNGAFEQSSILIIFLKLKIYFQENIWYRFPEYEEIIIKLKIYFYGILPQPQAQIFWDLIHQA